MTQKDVAELLRVTVRQVRNLRIKRVRIGRLVRYKPEDVRAFIDRQRAA
jgi:hypothetical protein